MTPRRRTVPILPFTTPSAPLRSLSGERGPVAPSGRADPPLELPPSPWEALARRLRPLRPALAAPRSAA